MGAPFKPLNDSAAESFRRAVARTLWYEDNRKSPDFRAFL